MLTFVHAIDVEHGSFRNGMQNYGIFTPLLTVRSYQEGPLMESPHIC